MKFNKSTPFRVPTLAEADADYAAMEAKLAELATEASRTNAEIDELAADIIARPAPRIQAGVAALLGETVDQTLASRPAKLAELRKHAADVDAAIEIIRRRMRDRQAQASVAACAVVRAEYGKRISALVEALDAVHAARLHADALLDGLENEGVQITYLPAVRANFLGERNDGHIHRFRREAAEAGYV
ncbi:hypothetical protein [Aliirhizobium cellulosilyticum]|uniref:Chromosome segregation ATPase n=1 Tax=Aliirhizobium cellulosilyticum TaxID=393664 RepID=A0A7W6UVB6_9HYPH|nr:hypothetical protein [Rhizobium cellulosilyticum]MBB4348021.1 chromosome segregation ATPase [Rhizobium cellulosilyticum]MBB4409585.1 chromosome segregation ATPase [Rhizobium cellulosilyticum]MBB4444274.1 chromosome segregation ATPase [Rhizobium cellulosilyticum]